jgi:cellulose synthase/poly-beta-1,6-N-acetylglucosamine synthase-like glycosyltransferase
VDLALTLTHWLGGGLLLYTFLGYPAVVRILGRMRAAGHDPTDCQPPSTAIPSVSVVLVVRNEADRIETRIENLLRTDHPGDLIEVIVVSDGSTDDSASRVRRSQASSIRLIENQSHRGKPACINDGVAAASGDIIVFADARQRFTSTTIPALVTAFSDPGVGAVSGELLIDESAAGVATGVDAYWRLEKAIRLGESRIDSAIGCTGAVYAIRRKCFEPLPEDTLIDDVVCPMRITLQGMRVLFCPEAIALDPQPLAPDKEMRRKRRTLAGNFQMLFRYPSWLLPWRNRLVIQLVSHKYLRLAAPVLLITTFLSSLILAGRGSLIYSVGTAVQIGFYLLAALGLALPRKTKLLSLPAAFVFLNFMTLLGLVDFVKKRKRKGW